MAPLGSASDLGYMLGDAGVPVVFEGVTSHGVLHIEDVQMVTFDGGTITGRKHRVVVATDAFKGLGENKTITVDGTKYRITQAWQAHDGKLTEVWLAAI